MASEHRARLRGLYAITPQSADTRRLLDLVDAALDGGAGLVQYRAKAMPADLALQQARGIADLCRAHDATFIVNDSIELALAARADGVHVGRDDAQAARARAALPAGIIGVSCYDKPGLAAAAREAGADYVAIGSVFASSSKPHAARASLANVREAKALSGLPVAAIGGIDQRNAAHAIDAGADMVAVIAAVFDAPDVRAAARGIAALFEVRAMARHDV
jgi:thiamine-phosphate pyrophosphorylase